jgi:hypothetical protein
MFRSRYDLTKVLLSIKPTNAQAQGSLCLGTVNILFDLSIIYCSFYLQLEAHIVS